MHEKEIKNYFQPGSHLLLTILFILFSSLILSLGYSILAPRTSLGASLIDAKFKLNRLTLNRDTSASNEVLHLYKDVFSRSLHSQCRWLPSDSEYLKITTQRCGQTRGTLFAFARFMAEHDANRASLDVVNDQNRLRFVLFKNDCNVF